jgi:pimeloyl-ACP methyl ester carboxylesterase
VPPEHEVVWQHEHLTTGLLEDVRDGILRLIDVTSLALRTAIPKIIHSILTFSWLLVLLNPFKIWQGIKSAFSLPGKFIRLFHPKNFVSSTKLDRRTKQEIVNQAGYPYESYKVITEDGYELLLERVGRGGEGRVVYLQHGVMANGFDWVANGPTQSLAFRAYELGFDVWIGNFRGGSGPEYKHVIKNISNASYWDFGMNEHAWRDIPAFINKILKTKRQEFAEQGIDKEVDITAISHSMGAASTIMYIVKSRMDNKPHHLSRAILLSVAGYHQAAPTLCKVVGPVLYKALHLFPVIHSFRFPSEIYRILVSKVIQDVKNSPAMKDLTSYFMTTLLGGRASSHPFTKVHNLTYNTFLGTPVKIFFHFWQIYRARKFQAFDYGPARNLIEYKQPTPIDMFDNYDKIDIPIYFMMGLLDNLIEPVNIIKHFTTLARVHPTLASIKAFPDLGHLDFTLGVNEQLMTYIEEILTHKTPELS